MESHASARVTAPTVAKPAANVQSAIQRLTAADSFVAWERQSILVGDVDCDGVPDSVFVGRSTVRVDVGLVRVNMLIPEVISFGVHAAVQNELGSNDAILKLESLDYDPSEAVGEVEGFQRSTECHGLNLGDGESDSMHLFWNRKSHHLDWWRA